MTALNETKLDGGVMAGDSNWKWALARGLFGVAFGVALLAFPFEGALAVGAAFALYVAVDGAIAIWLAARFRRAGMRWKFLAFEGVVGLIAGAAAAAFPAAAILALVALMSAWAVVTGVTEVYVGLTTRASFPFAALLVVAGVVSLAFGAAVIFWPFAGTIALLGIIAVYSILFGASLTVWAVQMGRHGRSVGAARAH